MTGAGQDGRGLHAPRYAQIVAALQQRIESGAYRPGSLLPSENQLIAEFGGSRSTVTRAVQVLR